MATQKVEFELLVTTTKADNSVLGVERKIVSLSSNLKDSINKLEVFKKALENTGNKFPALELLTKFKEELLAATRQTQSLDDSTKKVVKGYIDALKQTSLPAKLGNQLQPNSKQGVPFGIGELTPKKQEALAEFYKSLPAYATAGLSKKLKKELEEALKNTSLSLTVKQPPQPLNSRDILKASWEASLRDRFKEIASIPNVRPYQRPDEAARADFKDRFASYQGFKGVVKIADRAMQTNIASKQREVEAYQTYKPLTFAQRESERLQALQNQLFKIPQNERLGEFWAKTALQILAAKEALAKFIATEASLKFQKGLNDSVLPFGVKQIQAAKFENQYPAKVGQLTNRVAIEADNALAKVEKRFNNLIQSTAKKIDGTTDKTQRDALLRRMQELGKQAQSEIGNTQLSNQAKLLTASYRDELALLKEQNTQTSDLKKKNQELLDILNKIRQSNLSNQSARGLIAEVRAAKQALEDLDKAQRNLRINDKLNTRVASKGQDLLSSIDSKQQLSIVQSKYGTNSLQAINLSEQQKLAELRASADQKISRLSSNLSSSTTDAQRARLERQMNNIAAAYQNASSAIVAQSSALRANSLAIQAHLAASNNFLIRIGEYVLGYKAVNFAVESFSGFIRNIPDAGIKLENTKAVLQAMFVTTKDVNEQFSFLDSVADRTGARIKTLRTEFGDFSASAKAAGESVSNIQEAFANLSDVSTVLHLPEEKLHGALVAISQMYAKNQVMSEELKRQLGNVLPGSVAMFARSQNMSTKELLDAMKQGLVKPKDTVPQFLKFYKEVFAPEDAFKTASQGFNATIGRFENEYTRLSEDLYKKSSGALVNFTKTGTEGLKLVRDNLDGILTVLKDIALVAGIAGGSALFRSAINRSARGAISVVNRERTLANASLPLGQQQRILSETNPSDLALYATLGNLIPNAINIIKSSLTSMSPVVKVAALSLASIEYSWHRLEKLPAIDLGNGIKATYLEVLEEKLNSIVGSIERIASGVPTTGLEKTLSTLFQISEVGAKIKENFMFLPELFSTILMKPNEEEANALRRKKTYDKEQQDYKTFRENMMAESQKALLQEPANAIENTFDAKSFTRTIELVGRAISTQITAITQQANLEVSNIENRINRLDKKARYGLMSQGEVYLEKLRALSDVSVIRRRELTSKFQLNSIPIQLNNQFSQNNDIGAALDKKIEILQDQKAKLDVVIGGRQTIRVKNASGEAEDKTFSNLGYLANTDPSKGIVLNEKALKAQQSLVEAGRNSLIEALAKNPELNEGVKPAFLGLSAIVKDTELTSNVKALTEAVQQRNKLAEVLQSQAIGLETQATEAEKGISGKKKNLLESLLKDTAYLDIKKGLPVGLTASILAQESGGNSSAVSPKGAGGLMQLMPKTAKGYGVTDRFDPVQSLEGGTSYLQDLLYKFPETKGDLTKVIAGYNAGQGAVGKYKGVPPYAETQDYVGKVGNNLAYLQKNMDSLLPKLENIKELPEKFRVAGAASISRGFSFQQAGIENNLAFDALKQKDDQDRRNLILDFSLAKVDFENALKSQINVPFRQQFEPLSFSGQKEALDQQFAPLRRQLEAELKASAKGLTPIVPETEIKDYLKKIKALTALPEQMFDISQREIVRAEKLRSIDLKAQAMQSTYAYQVASPFEQTLFSSANAKERLASLQENRGSFVADTQAKRDLSPLQKDNIIKEYDNAIVDLQARAEGVGNFFRTTLSQSMQSPIKDFVTGVSSLEGALKGFGVNILSSVAENIIQSFSNSLADMVMKAGLEKGATSILSFASGFFSQGGSIKGFASGGSMDAPQILTKTQKISGAGSGKSDSISAIAQKGAYVINAEASQRVKLSNGELYIAPDDVQRIGKDRLDEINFGGRYVSGGEIGSSAKPPLASKGSAQTQKIENTYYVTIEVKEKDSASATGETIADSFVRKVQEISKKEATVVTQRLLAVHTKTQHKGG